MKAIAFQKTGTVDVLKMLDLPKPMHKPDQVLVRVVAAGINPGDTLFRSGKIPFVRLKYPFIPGLDIAGIIEEVGTEVKQFQVGAHVYGMLPNTQMGGYADYAAIDAGAIAPMPANLTFAEAAAVPCAALTALQVLTHIGNLQAGQQVLINGASGGVGSFAVQIAKALGAQVTATTSPRNVELVRGLGADTVIDYTQIDYTEHGCDLFFDAVGLLPYHQVQKSLRLGGYGMTVNPLRGNPLAQLRARLSGRRWQSLFVKPNGEDLQRLNGWLSTGKVCPVLDQCYPLANAADAHRYSESKRVRGKLVLVVDEELATQPCQ